MALQTVKRHSTMSKAPLYGVFTQLFIILGCFCPTKLTETFIFPFRFPDVPGEVQEENGIKFKCQVFKRVTVEEQ